MKKGTRPIKYQAYQEYKGAFTRLSRGKTEELKTNSFMNKGV